MRKQVLMLLAIVAGTAMFSSSALAAEPAKPQPQKHIVVAGESLSSIATDSHLDTWLPLWNVNTDLANPDTIDVGQTLVVPTADDKTPNRPLPAAVAAPTVHYSQQTRGTASHQPANYSGGTGGILERIRMREAGGNYATNTGNGYYGAYQYNDGTWGGYGGYAHASDAPPAVQDAKAAQTYAARGCSPWPNTCY